MYTAPHEIGKKLQISILGKHGCISERLAFSYCISNFSPKTHERKFNDIDRARSYGFAATELESLSPIRSPAIHNRNSQISKSLRFASQRSQKPNMTTFRSQTSFYNYNESMELIELSDLNNRNAISDLRSPIITENRLGPNRRSIRKPLTSSMNQSTVTFDQKSPIANSPIAKSHQVRSEQNHMIRSYPSNEGLLLQESLHKE